MFQPVVQVQLALVDAFASQTERGTGGFGSTGKA
jgi:dUTP pyrophosphatase